MLAYTRYSYHGADGKTVFIGKDETMLKPWAVFKDNGNFVQQVSKWYAYRGWAERALKNRGDYEN